jgi:hypothetical protein
LGPEPIADFSADFTPACAKGAATTLLQARTSHPMAKPKQPAAAPDKIALYDALLASIAGIERKGAVLGFRGRAIIAP